MSKPTVPMIDVQAILMFRASCVCGWWKVTGDDESEAKAAVMVHVLATRCDGCMEHIDHDDAVIVDDGDRTGAYCSFCAPHYAAPAA